MVLVLFHKIAQEIFLLAGKDNLAFRRLVVKLCLQVKPEIFKRIVKRGIQRIADAVVITDAVDFIQIVE